MAAAMLHPMPRQTPTPPPDTPHLSLETNRSSSAPIPNKHLPFCPPGPAPAQTCEAPSTPPDTPPSATSGLQTFSPLSLAARYCKIVEKPAVYSINCVTLGHALKELSIQPFPDPQASFPWLHGLHAENHMQLAFFTARNKTQRHPPKCFRGITIIKAGGDLSKGRLQGAVSAAEILEPSGSKDARFSDVDPREGFSVRNFQIQVAKMAMLSDLVVYRDRSTSREEMHNLARKLATAQKAWRIKSGFAQDANAPTYNTFILSDSFEEVEKKYPSLVAIDSAGDNSEHTLDFFQMERHEMCKMSEASEITHNVWLGPTPDAAICRSENQGLVAFDLLIEANDLATLPDVQTLNQLAEDCFTAPQNTDFPSSGSMLPQSYPKSTVNPLTRMCQWMHRLANGETQSEGSEDASEPDSDGDIPMHPLSRTGRKILIHCTDGYTESSLLALAYFMYAEQVPVHEAWLRLHCEKKRNFFAYPSDVVLLNSLQPHLVPPKPVISKSGHRRSIMRDPSWLGRMDGSLPSRILPYLYLGNLGHANNPDLLKAMGITQILSVGEPINWTPTQIENWGTHNLEDLLYVDGVQDNGVDALSGEFERCLDFIAKGKSKSTATLVHCRVGVSRSATICIAEVMASLGLSFPRAYCYVRARRLNVIIQPHLRFAYELLKWDEECQQRRGEGIRREVEWGTLCREIAGMNKPYCSR